MTGTEDDGAVIDAVFAAMAAGDLEAARDCFAPDAAVWHGFDRLVRDRDETIEDWRGLIGAFPERGVQDVRRQGTGAGSFVQQHLFVVRDAAGTRRAWPVCIVVRTAAGRIARLDEYIDRAGSYTAPDGALTTPGF